MPTLPNMGLVTPTPGGSSGTWDDELNTALGVVDAHTHASGSGVRITPAAININADLTMAGFGLTNLDRAAFAAIVALTTGSRVLFVSSSDNELYWRTNGGTNVKLTNGNALNVSAFVGGIGGDYTAVSAALNYDDSNARYTHKGASGTNWARLASGEVRIYETGTSETVYIGHAAPSALGASYTVTWPTALPGAATLMQVSSAGQVSFSNTVAESLTVSGGLQITGQAALASVISPSALGAGNTNDYDPTGLSTANVIRITPILTSTLTGLAGGAAGRVLVMVNISAEDLTLDHQDGSSAAANQFRLVGATSMVIPSFGSVVLWYDGTASKWCVVAKSL